MTVLPLLFVEEDRAHPRRDTSDHTNLSTQPSVLMAVFDQNLNQTRCLMTITASHFVSHLNVWAVPVLAAEDVVFSAGGWVVRALGAAWGHGAVAYAWGGRRVAGRG